MKDCMMIESIGKGQCKKKEYYIWTVFDGQSTLCYWYVVMSDDTYCNHFEKKSGEELAKIEDEITNKAIDIRNLPNYKKLSPTDILFHRKDTVVPMIKEAVRKGYVQPL